MCVIYLSIYLYLDIVLSNDEEHKEPDSQFMNVSHNKNWFRRWFGVIFSYRFFVLLAATRVVILLVLSGGKMAATCNLIQFCSGMHA